MRRNSASSVSQSVSRYVLLAIGMLSLPDESFAVDRRYSGAAGAGTFFGTPGNWVGNVVPGVLDVAQFGRSTNLFLFQYTVNFNNNATNQALHIEDDLVTFALNDRMYTVTTASGIVIGNDAGSRPASLTILDGIVSSTTNIDVGAAANRTGTLIVGADGLISGSPTLNIGKLGTGTLTVQSDGDISTTGATNVGIGNGVTGTATIIGNASPGSATLLTGALNVGSTGIGTANVQLGGFLQNSGAAVIGSGNLFTGTGTGIVNVMNAGSTWNSLGLLEVGAGGSGEVNVTLGGTLNAANSIIGANVTGGGEVNVDGLNSLWDNSGTLTIGGLGVGALNITNQGVVESFAGLVGDSAFPSSTGTVVVNGAGSRWTNTDDLAVGVDGTGSMNITAGGTVQDVDGYVGRDASGTGTFSVAGPGSLWENSGNLLVGYAGEGTLSVTSGGKVLNVNGTGTVGYVSSGTGTVIVDGDGSQWNSNHLSVGYAGAGTLSITGGGMAQCVRGAIGSLSASTGHVTVAGAGSRWEYSEFFTAGEEFSGLFVGDLGDGTLDITDGGHVISTTSQGFVASCIGCASSGTGRVHVDGTGSLWDAAGEVLGIITVGDQGDGTLEITNGAVVRSSQGDIGKAASGTGHVIVDGPGSLWNSWVNVGTFGRGKLDITGGGVVQSGTGTIDGPADSPSTVVVDGVGSRWEIASQFSVGLRATNPLARTGKLDITGGGLVTTGGDSFLGTFTNTTGQATVAGAGSTWEVGGKLWIGGDFTQAMSTGIGSLRVQPGGTVNVEEEIVASRFSFLTLEGGTISTPQIQFVDSGTADVNFQWFSGTLQVGHFNSNLAVPNGGIFAPENPLGAIVIVGDYTSAPGATLQIDVGGLNAGGDSDAVIAEDVVLNGNLQLKLINGFVPNAAAEISILVAFGELSGQFANVAPGQRLSTTDGLGSFIVNYGPGSAFNDDTIVLSSFLSSAIPGDYNGDGTVDAADYTVWRNSVGNDSLINRGPGISGSVGDEDYAVWKANFGNSLTGAAASNSATIPEPSALSISTLGLLVVTVCRRRSHLSPSRATP